MPPLKVLVTGATGLVGQVVYQHLTTQPEQFDVFALDRYAQPSERAAGAVPHFPPGRFWQVDLGDLPAVERAVTGMDAVAHFAADPRPEAPWESLLASNLIGAYHLFEACYRAQVPRVVYASSMMALWGHFIAVPYEVFMQMPPEAWPSVMRADMPPPTVATPPRPGDLYGASKAWGEALASVYALRGLSCRCIRFGAVNAANQPGDANDQLWCSHHDAAQLTTQCLLAPLTQKFDILHAANSLNIQEKPPQ